MKADGLDLMLYFMGLMFSEVVKYINDLCADNMNGYLLIR